ncbi:MAG: hypothetical protein ABSC25_00825 [Roseiarcus sp.]|jgi:hypothetical protein
MSAAAKVLEFPAPPETPAAPSAPDAPAVDGMALLIAERAALAGELARLGALSSARGEAEGRLGEIDSEVRRLDDADTHAWSAWARAGGESPMPRLAERRELAQRRVAALAEIDSARIAEAAVQGQVDHIRAELRRADAAMRALRISAVMATAKNDYVEALAGMAESGARLQKLEGLRDALLSLANSAAGRGEQDARIDFLHAVAAFDEKFKAPVVKADRAVVAAHAADWKRTLQ